MISFDFLKTNKFKSLLLAILATMALPYMLQVEEPMFLSNSVISLIICWGFFIIIKKLLDNKEEKFFKFSCLLGFFFSFLLVLGRNFALFANIDISFIGISKLIIIALAFSPVFSTFIFHVLKKIVNDKFFNCLDNSKIKKFFEYGPKYFWKMFLVIILCWLPIYYCFFPGVFEYDVPTQLNEVFSGQLTNWHPVLHTLYLYHSLMLGFKLFNSYDIGLVIHIVPQMIIMALICAYCCNYFAKIKVPVLVQLLSLSFFALNPLVSIHVVSVTKDVLFGGFILLFSILTLQMTLETEQFFKSIKKILLLVLAISFSLCFRTNAIILLIFLMPFFIFVFRKYFIKTFCIFFFPISLYLIVLMFIFPMLNIGQTPPEESISVPLQQVARVLKYQDEYISDEDKNIFYEIVQEGSLDRYHHRCMDNLKINEYTNWLVRTFNDKKFLENPKKYFDLWLRLGKEYPQEYLKAFLNLNVPWWYPDYIYVIKEQAYNPFIALYVSPASLTKISINNFPERKRVFDLFLCRDIYIKERPLYSRIFITANISSIGVYFWVILFTIFLALYFRRINVIFPVIIPFYLIIMYFFAPVYLLRYAYPIMLFLPILLAILIQLIEKEVVSDTNN